MKERSDSMRNASVPYIRSSLLEEVPHAKHAFFTRQGGVSIGDFSSLNTGMEKGDPEENVLENRQRISQTFGLFADKLVILRQQHTADAYVVSQPFSKGAIPDGDGLATTEPNLILGIQTADCVPVLFADKTLPIIGAAHAGWRGAVKGVLENTLKEMVRLGSKVENIVAALGPCIWQESYEVSKDFYEDLLDVPQFFMQGERQGFYQFDLPGFVMYRLKNAGIMNISPSPANTYKNEENFFSCRRKTHRREANFGVQLSAIMLRGN